MTTLRSWNPPRLPVSDAGVAAIACTVKIGGSAPFGKADWDSIAQLRELIPDVPILGNGDIFSAEDAIADEKRSDSFPR